jgi:hypothetical protein
VTGTTEYRTARYLLGVGLGLIVATAAFAQAAVPVTVGRYGADLDACGSQGQVTGLNPGGDNFLAVRVGPGVQYEKFDELHKGDIVSICETQGGWLGIVYGKQDCGVGTPLPKGPYAGPCRAGWVAEQYVVVIAG